MKKQFQKKRRRPQKSDFQSGNDKKDGTLDIGVSFLKLSIADRDRRNVDKIVAAVRKTCEDERLHGLPGVSRIQAIERCEREYRLRKRTWRKAGEIGLDTQS